jgi:hypothetical protein
MKSLDNNLEFHFIKNGNHNSTKKMPVHSIKIWGHELGMAAISFEDMRRKKQVKHVCLGMKMNDDIIVDRGFKIGGIVLRTTKDVIKKKTDFHELWMFEKMEYEEETVERSLTSLGGGESSAMWCPKKKTRKKPNDTQKKEKNIGKICACQRR